MITYLLLPSTFHRIVVSMIAVQAEICQYVIGPHILIPPDLTLC